MITKENLEEFAHLNRTIYKVTRELSKENLEGTVEVPAPFLDSLIHSYKVLYREVVNK
jgi:hypothetical protein